MMSCHHCPLVFKRKEDFEEHSRSGCGWQDLEHNCKRCNDFTARNIVVMANHIKDCPKETNGKLRFLCTFCKRHQILTISGFQRHKQICGQEIQEQFGRPLVAPNEEDTIGRMAIADMIITCTRCGVFQTTSMSAMTDHFRGCPMHQQNPHQQQSRLGQQQSNLYPRYASERQETRSALDGTIVPRQDERFAFEPIEPQRMGFPRNREEPRIREDYERQAERFAFDPYYVERDVYGYLFRK